MYSIKIIATPGHSKTYRLQYCKAEDFANQGFNELKDFMYDYNNNYCTIVSNTNAINYYSIEIAGHYKPIYGRRLCEPGNSSSISNLVENRFDFNPYFTRPINYMARVKLINAPTLKS